MDGDIIFHKIKIDDKDWIIEKQKEDYLETCDLPFASNFIWAKAYDVEVADVEGCVIIRYAGDDQKWCTFPMGNGDRRKAVERLLETCHKNKTKAGFYPISEKQRILLNKWFPSQFEIEAHRDDFDYVYLTENLVSLKGRKYQSKRNHIHRFMDNNKWSYEKISADNIEECMEVEQGWMRFKQDKTDADIDVAAINNEEEALKRAFINYEKLGLVGGLLRQEDKIVAFAIGEELNRDTFVVHFEKAYAWVNGAYPMINREFAAHECGNYKYVNREEDTGDAGLRKAKMSYHPDMLIKKYSAIESDIVYADEDSREQIKDIWQQCFGDEDSYIDMYLDNRFTNQNMMTIHEDEKIVSMASFLPVTLTVEGGEMDAMYVYAVATMPGYRNKGYAAKILQHASLKYKVPLVLQQADEGLKDYYEKRGFKAAFSGQSWEIYISCRTEDIEPMEEAEISAKDYKLIRDKKFASPGYVKWDEAAVAYALMENEFCGGRAVSIGDDIFLYRIEENAIRIVETTLDKKGAIKAAEGLMKKYGIGRAFYENCGGMIKMSNKRLTLEDGYLNLTLS